MARSASREAKHQRASSPGSVRRDTQDRIIAAAYRCFDEIGIAKTTMEDIARGAEVSRPTVYQYFRSKTEIIYHISMIEALKLNAEIRRRCVRRDDPIDTIVEAQLIAARVSIDNIYVRRVMESIYVPAMSMDPHGPVHKLNREWWRGLIERAMRDSRLADDLDLDQIVSWLSLSQSLLLMKIDAEELKDSELRDFIRRFIVRPLLP